MKTADPSPPSDGLADWIQTRLFDAVHGGLFLATGAADLVSFGRPFICTPDLVRRLRENAAWNALDPSTLYGGGAKGYTDYPTLDEPVTA